MNRTKRLIIVLVLLAVVLALPTGLALANKKLWKARLSTGAELHQVVGSRASGSAAVAGFPTSLRFQVAVMGLSGQPTAAHIHAPASASENGPVVVTLCGAGPAPIFATCPFDANGGVMMLEGTIPATAIQGLTITEFFTALSDGMAYINVHTELNPAGEVRGQLDD